MVQPIHSRKQLEKFSISELRAECDRLCIPRRRSIKDCITDILAAQPQPKKALVVADKQVMPASAQSEIEEQTDDYLFHSDEEQPTNLPKVDDTTYFIGCFLLRCAQVGGDYAVVWDVHDENNTLMGEIRMGWDCFWSHPMSFDMFATPQEAVINLYESLLVLVEEQRTQPEKAIAFDKVADGRWQSIVNGMFVRITSVQDGYKTNLTGDVVLADYVTAIKESLLAVARLQPSVVEEVLTEVKPEFEIFTTRLPNVFAIHSHKSGQRYEVYPDSNSCTCPHWLHRHEQEGFKDKHLDAVKAALQSGIPLMREPQTDTEKLIEKFTDEFGWIGGGQIAQARVWLESRFGSDFTEAILSGEAKNKALQQEEQMDKEMANW
ncbi:MAG: hypothetical protein V7L31_20885 [Nostoc sp.]|uniref:hypothetical protein n=1 Tax=Nostoc sp. TaxID=1180 RepID=UPI002FEE8E7E